MHDRAVELVQVAELLQGVGDICVGELGFDHEWEGRRRAASVAARARRAATL